MSINSDLSLLLNRYSKEFSDFDGLILTDPNQQGYGDDAPLHVAARHGLLRDIELLVRAGAAINMPGDIGCTPLHYAAMTGCEDTVRKLLELGANPKLVNEFNQTAAETAALGGYHELSGLLKQLEKK